MMNSEVEQAKSGSTGPSEEELEAAKKVLASLILAKKNYALYPEGHTICTNSLKQFQMLLNMFLQKYGDLKIDVDRDQLATHGEVILTEPPEEGTLPFILYRDGIQWLEFLNGINMEELQEFLRIICKYSILSAEPDGDVVTDFWENQLPHIKYQVADFFLGVDTEESLTPAPITAENKGAASLRERRLAEVEPIPDPLIEQTEVALTPDDLARIKDMIRLEEEGDPTAYLDALLDSLLQHKEQDNFEIILEVLEEEFKNSLGRKDFDIPLKILRSLDYIIKSFESKIAWAAPLVEDFVLTVSSTHALGTLLDVCTELDSVQIEKLRLVLNLLQPEAIHSIGAMLQQNIPVKLRQMLIESITTLASRDYGPLESLLKNPDEKLMERLVHVFVSLEGERPLKALMKLIHHPSPQVRQEAVKGIFLRGSARREVFNLIDDKDESIRRMIMKQMAQSRNPAAEKYLLDYLEHRKFKSSDDEHVIACFTILGQCGSSKSVPFLRSALFEDAWKSIFSKSVYREGAAIALNRLKINEAQKVLDDAKRSFYPAIRGLAKNIKK